MKIKQLEQAKKRDKGVNSFNSHPGYLKPLDNQGVLLFNEESRPKSRPNNPPKGAALFEEFKSKCLQVNTAYRRAQLYSANNDLGIEWYVYYYFEVPNQNGNYKRFKERFDINRKKTLRERLDYGKQMVEFINQKLEAGYNPWLEADQRIRGSNVSILQQLQFIVAEICNDETETAKRLHNSHINRFQRYLEEKKLISIPLGVFTENQAEDYKTWMIEQKLAVKTINESLTYMVRYFKAARRKKWCLINQFENIEHVSKRKRRNENGEPEKFEPITAVEMRRIFPMLREKNEVNYINFLSIIFYAWARPIEICRLRVGDIDIDQGIITFASNETKNLSYAHVQIVPQLKALLEKIDLDKYPTTYYLFSRDDMKPGPEQVAKNYTADKWNRLVKHEKGLNIKKDQYALKHTGNIDYLLRNKGKTDLKWQQMQNRHKTASMTERYIRKLGAYFIEVGEINFSVF